MTKEQRQFLENEIARQGKLIDTLDGAKQRELNLLPGSVGYLKAIEDNIKHLRKLLRG